MARRGRFGRSDTGASNLSAMIRSLLAQQQAAEEQVLLKAFYDGTEYNGKVPTMADISAFYNKAIENGGYEPGSADYVAIKQKIGEANNFDIKRSYNALISDFNTSNGANYDQVIAFLNGRGKETTNVNDQQDFANAFESVTSAYITFMSNKLVNGALSIDEYRNKINSALGLLDPNSETYKDSVVTARTTEFKYEKNTMDKRLALRKISLSEYRNWAREFRNTVTSTGVPAEDLVNDIDLVIQELSSRMAAASAASAKKKSGVAETGILNLYAIAASSGVVPVDEVTLKKLASNGGEPFDIKDVIANPEVIATYMRLVDQGAIKIDPRLEAAGIQEGFQLRAYYDSELNTYLGGLQKSYAITGSANDMKAYSEAKSLYYRTGSRSGLDEVADAASQYTQDIQNAGTDDFAIKNAISEWNKYLSGRDSKYGVLPDLGSLVPPEYSVEQTMVLNYLTNSAAVAEGKLIPKPGQMTLEGAMNVTVMVDGKEISIQELYQNGSVQANEINYNALISGTAAQQISIKNGQPVKETVELPAINSAGAVGETQAQAKVGRLNQISFIEIEVLDPATGLPTKKVVPFVQSTVAANPIMIGTSTDTASLTRWGFKYIVNGEEIYVRSSDGATYSQNPFKSVLGSIGDSAGTMVPVGDSSLADGVTSTNAVPGVDVTSLYKIYGENNVQKLRQLGQDIVGTLLNPQQNPQVASMLQVIGANNQESVSAAAAAIIRRADEVELKQVQDYSFRLGEKGDAVDRFVLDSVNSRVAELQASLYGGEYQSSYNNQFSQFSIVQNNRDKYDFDQATGDWVLRPYWREQKAQQALQASKNLLLSGGIVGTIQNLASSPENLPDRISTRMTKPTTTSREITATGEIKQAIPGAAAQAATASYLTGQYGAQPSAAYPFFRNMATATTATAAPTAAAVAVAAPVSLPTAKVTTATVPKTKQQAQALIQSMPFDPSDPEARRALVQLESTLPSQTSPIKNIGAR